MRETTRRVLALFLSSSFVFSCSASHTGQRPTSSVTATPTARPASEVLLKLRDEPAVPGKLIGFENDVVTFLPSTYWNTDPRTFLLDEIVSIKVRHRESVKGRWTWIAFATGFVVSGCACGAGAKYNEDYWDCFGQAAGAGAASGLVGLALGAIRDAGRPGTYRFDTMTTAERQNAVRRLMAR